MATVTDDAGNVWRNHYDLRGRKVRTEDPDRGTTAFVYDAADQLVATTDARGESIVYTYDELGRKVAQNADGQDGPLLAEWTFDTVAKGELSTAVRHVDGLKFTTSIGSYDAMARATSTTINIPPDPAHGGLSGSYRFRSTYNTDGSVRTNTLPEAGGLPEEAVSYTYNEQGMATRVRGLSAYESMYYVNATSYSKLGLVLQRESYRADGSRQAQRTWATRTYDPATNRLLTSRVHHELGAGTLVEQTYGYDDAGNILSIRDTPTAEGLTPDVQCFTYDHMRRLASEWSSMAGGEDPCADGPSATTVGGAAPYWNDFAYDELGNRITETRHGLVEGEQTVNTFHRPSAGDARPHAVTSVESTDPLDNAEYTYDEAGNMVTRVTGNRAQELEWDAEGQLVAVREGNQTSEFVYGADGERLLRDNGTVVTLYLPGMEIQYDKENLASEATRLYEHNGEVVASRSSAGVHWIFSDHHKTGQLAMDSVTGEQIRRRFTAFGQERGTTGGPWPNSRGFVGGVIDDDLGLTRLGARSYDPDLGSFVSADPIMDLGDSQQMHAYAYANNNPVSFTDPDGLFLKKAFSRYRAWKAYRLRQAAIRAYQAKLAAIRAWKIRQAQIRAARIRAAKIRAAKIRAAKIRAAKIRAARARAAAEKAAARRKAAQEKARLEAQKRAEAAKRRDMARRAAERRAMAERKQAIGGGKRDPEHLGLHDGPVSWPRMPEPQAEKPRENARGRNVDGSGYDWQGFHDRVYGENPTCVDYVGYNTAAGVGLGAAIGGTMGGVAYGSAGAVFGSIFPGAGTAAGGFGGVVVGTGVGAAGGGALGGVIAGGGTAVVCGVRNF